MVLIFLLACASCEKDSDNRSKEELLLAHIWNWNKMTTTSTNEEVQDLIAVFSVLMTGTTLEFHPDGSYTIASPLSDPDVADWEFLDDMRFDLASAFGDKVIAAVSDITIGINLPVACIVDVDPTLLFVKIT